MLQILPKNRGLGYTLNVNHFEEYVNLYPDNIEILREYFDVVEEGFWMNFFWKEGAVVANHANPNPNLLVDAFSPNLNKQLHIGHARGFVNSIFLNNCCGYRLCSLLGKSLGELEGAEDWYDLFNTQFGLNPEKFYDTELQKKDLNWEEKDGAKFINNVCVIRSNGKPTYSYYELLFQDQVGPDLIFTGVEQKEHFEALGLSAYHVPIGLIVSDKGKLSSRTGEAITLKEFIGEIASHFPDNPHKNKIAWNIIIGKLSSCTLSQNVKYDLDQWLDLKNSKGLYITYTMCRLQKLIDKFEDKNLLFSELICEKEMFRLASYHKLAREKAILNLEPKELLDAIFLLCQEANSLYEKEKILGNKNLEMLIEVNFRLIHSQAQKLGIREVDYI